GKAAADMRWAPSAQLPLELALIELARSDGAARAGGGGEAAHAAIADLAQRVARLEERVQRLAGGGLRQPPERTSDAARGPASDPAPAPEPPATAPPAREPDPDPVAPTETFAPSPVPEQAP